MKYIVLIDTEEKGPVSQDILIKWAKTGDITPATQVRNAILKKWRKASDYDFLKETFSILKYENTDTSKDTKKTADNNLAKKSLEEIEDEEELYEKLKKHTSYKNPFLPDPSPISLRFFAAIFDYILVGLISFGFLCIMANLILNNSISLNLTFYLTFFFSFSLLLVYYAACLGVFAQTFGMWFWGIIIVQKGNEGKPVYLHKAFWFTVLMFVLGIFALFFMYLTGKRRALHDMCCGTQIVRISARVK